MPKHIARQYKNEAKRKKLDERNKTKPRKLLETEKREEGLNKTISSDNKGFAMLQKMGFKPGMTLGKKGLGQSLHIRSVSEIHILVQWTIAELLREVNLKSYSSVLRN